MWTSSRVSGFPLGVLLLLAMATVAGCRPAEGIDNYQTLKYEELQKAGGGTLVENAAVPAADAKPQRMLGAILPQGDQLWFFKVMGEPQAVAPLTTAWRELLKSVTFPSSDSPTWTLPEGWRASDRSHPLRFATLLAGEPPLEITISALSKGDGDLEPALMANINRWRGQLGLSPLSDGQLAQESETLETPAGKLVLVDLEGLSAGGGMGSAPFAGGMGRGTLPPGAADRNAPPSNLKYDTPEGWTPGRAGGLRKAAFVVTAAELGKVEITVIDLPREAGGDRLANVNRWRMQIGLKDLEASELPASLKKIPVGDLEGDYCTLIGDPNAERPQSILGVLVDHGELTWFIKLQGDAKLAEREQSHFEAFAKSLKFE